MTNFSESEKRSAALAVIHNYVTESVAFKVLSSKKPKIAKILSDVQESQIRIGTGPVVQKWTYCYAAIGSKVYRNQFNYSQTVRRRISTPVFYECYICENCYHVKKAIFKIIMRRAKYKLPAYYKLNTFKEKSIGRSLKSAGLKKLEDEYDEYGSDNFVSSDVQIKVSSRMHDKAINVNIFPIYVKIGEKKEQFVGLLDGRGDTPTGEIVL